MKVQVIALGAIVGFVLALSPSCSPTPANAPCSSDNCAGCCNGDTCVAAGLQNVTTCGAGGSACAACGADQVCTAGLCQDATVCGPSNCDGCCSPMGCMPGTDATNCGHGGQACSACGVGEKCYLAQGTKGGVCDSRAADVRSFNFGTPCESDSECATLFNVPDAVCKRTTSLGNASYPDGYCTIRCTTNADCGSDQSRTAGRGFCMSLPPDVVGEEDSICWDRCDPSLDPCRPGYACYEVSDGGPSGCWIDPLPAFDGGWTIGNACTDDSECHPPSSGTCKTDDAGFPNGSCTAECIDNPDRCGSGNVCLCANQDCTTAGCFAGCAVPGGPSTCRTGYTCFQLTGLSTGVCFPDCTVTGCDADAGETCGSNGFCTGATVDVDAG